MGTETRLVRSQVLPAGRAETCACTTGEPSATGGEPGAGTTGVTGRRAARVPPGAAGPRRLRLLGGVLLDGLEDGVRDRGRGGEVVAAGAEAVLIGDVVDGVGGAVVALVGVGALDHAGFLVAACVLQFPGFLLAYAVFGFVAGSRREFWFLGGFGGLELRQRFLLALLFYCHLKCL